MVVEGTREAFGQAFVGLSSFYLKTVKAPWSEILYFSYKSFWVGLKRDV